MSSKVIDDSFVSLAETIKGQHTQINQLKDTFETDKDKLSSHSKELFLKDISEGDIVGNHEYHTTDGTVTVNFKINGRPLTEINGKPAINILRDKFKESVDELFSQDTRIKVTPDEPKLRSQACAHPECFDIGLKPLTHEEKMRLVAEHPDWITVQVTDLERYAEVYPACVEKETSVNFKQGFIESLSKLDTVVRKSAAGLLKALLPDVLQTAVNCGNRSKKK